MSVNSYEDLVAWQFGHAVTLQVYRWTRGFPREEFYGMVQQLRRAASSVPSNIAEGSADELGYWIRLASELGYGGDPGDLREKVKSTARLVRRLTDVTLARV